MLGLVQDGPALAPAARFSEPSGYTAVAAGPLRVQATSGSAQGTTTLDAAPNSIYTLLVLNDDRGGLELRAVQDAAGAGAVCREARVNARVWPTPPPPPRIIDIMAPRLGRPPPPIMPAPKPLVVDTSIQ